MYGTFKRYVAASSALSAKVRSSIIGLLESRSVFAANFESVPRGACNSAPMGAEATLLRAGGGVGDLTVTSTASLPGVVRLAVQRPASDVISCTAPYYPRLIQLGGCQCQEI